MHAWQIFKKRTIFGKDVRYTRFGSKNYMLSVWRKNIITGTNACPLKNDLHIDSPWPDNETLTCSTETENTVSLALPDIGLVEMIADSKKRQCASQKGTNHRSLPNPSNPR